MTNKSYPISVSSQYVESRRRKARKIVAILDDFDGKAFRRTNCLDVGCSQGIITNELAGRFSLAVGVDVDGEALKNGKNSTSGRATLLSASGLSLPFAANTFDVVICAQVYEHVDDARMLFSEIRRVLKDDGICFFSGPNKLFPFDDHYRLPFVHWLPHSLAGTCLSALSHKVHAIKMHHYWELRRILRGFDIIDYTPKLMKHPSAFHCTEEVKPPYLSRIPSWIVERLACIFPNYNWILRKQD